MRTEATCDVCGSPVWVVSSGEGTMHYESRATVPEIAAKIKVAALEAERDRLQMQCEWWMENSQIHIHLYCQGHHIHHTAKYLEGAPCPERDCRDCRAAYLATEPWEATAEPEESETSE